MGDDRGTQLWNIYYSVYTFIYAGTNVYLINNNKQAFCPAQHALGKQVHENHNGMKGAITSCLGAAINMPTVALSCSFTLWPKAFHRFFGNPWAAGIRAMKICSPGRYPVAAFVKEEGKQEGLSLATPQHSWTLPSRRPRAPSPQICQCCQATPWWHQRLPRIAKFFEAWVWVTLSVRFATLNPLNVFFSGLVVAKEISTPCKCKAPQSLSLKAWKCSSPGTSTNRPKEAGKRAAGWPSRVNLHRGPWVGSPKLGCLLQVLHLPRQNIYVDLCPTQEFYIIPPLTAIFAFPFLFCFVVV